MEPAPGKKQRVDDGHMEKFVDLKKILGRDSPFENSTGALPMGKFEPGAKVSRTAKSACWLCQPAFRDGLRPTVCLQAEEKLARAKVCVIGAGGLGCEVSTDGLQLSIACSRHCFADLERARSVGLSRHPRG